MSDPLSQLNALINSHQGQDEVTPDASQPEFRISLNPHNLELWRLEHRQIAGKGANLLLACLSSTGPLEETSLGWVVGAAIRPASVNSQEDCKVLLHALGLSSDLINSVLLNCPGIAGKVAWALYLERHGHLVATPVLDQDPDSNDIKLQVTARSDDMKQLNREWPMDERLRELTAKARIFGLMHDQSLPPSIRAILQQADGEARALSDDELGTICSVSTVNAEHLQRLQSKTPLIVTSAKSQLLREDPGLVQPGGALYPGARAEACWRDCWHFLRVTIYAVAAGRPIFTHPPGVEGLRDLYRELGVPVNSMAQAIGFLKTDALSHYSTYASPNDASLLGEALLHLEQMMQQLNQRSSPATEVNV